MKLWACTGTFSHQIPSNAIHLGLPLIAATKLEAHTLKISLNAVALLLLFTGTDGYKLNNAFMYKARSRMTLLGLVTIWSMLMSQIFTHSPFSASSTHVCVYELLYKNSRFLNWNLGCYFASSLVVNLYFYFVYSILLFYFIYVILYLYFVYSPHKFEQIFFKTRSALPLSAIPCQQLKKKRWLQAS